MRQLRVSLFCVEIDQVNILINAPINSIGNKTLRVEAKKFNVTAHTVLIGQSKK